MIRIPSQTSKIGDASATSNWLYRPDIYLMVFAAQPSVSFLYVSQPTSSEKFFCNHYTSKMTFQFGSERHLRGQASEQRFFEKMRALGHTVTPATPTEDKTMHFDCRVGAMRIDVKGLKKVCGTMQDALTWVEVANEYKCGWLYAPHPTHFAFEQLDGTFLLIAKPFLQRIVALHYKNATQLTNIVSMIRDNPTKYCYARLNKNPDLPALNRERVLLVSTSYIREHATIIH